MKLACSANVVTSCSLRVLMGLSEIPVALFAIISYSCLIPCLFCHYIVIMFKVLNIIISNIRLDHLRPFSVKAFPENPS